MTQATITTTRRSSDIDKGTSIPVNPKATTPSKALLTTLLALSTAPNVARASNITSNNALRAAYQSGDAERLLQSTCIEDVPQDSGFGNFLETLNIFTRDEIDFIAKGIDQENNSPVEIQGSIELNTNECPNGLLGKKTGKAVEDASFKSALAILHDLKKNGIDRVQLTEICLSDDLNLLGDLFPYNDDITRWHAGELMISLNVGVKVKEGDETIAENIERKILDGIKGSTLFQDAVSDCKTKRTRLIVIPTMLVLAIAGSAAAMLYFCR